MSLKALSDYTFYSRYSRFNHELERRETWQESVGRVFDMHRQKYSEEIKLHPELLDEILFAEEQQKKKRVLASQRSLQFAGTPIMRHHLKSYNCTAVHIDRPRVFQEVMYVLLCGAGVGFSVQKHHIDQLPDIAPIANINDKITLVVEDSIEGWSDAIGALMNSYFVIQDGTNIYQGKYVTFDYSQVRPEGALIAGQFKAPGPLGLRNSIERIRKLMNTITSSSITRLRPIHAYDCIMHISDAVLSGGVRRSATICQFSHDDEEMMNAKTGNWFIDNPQRARSNNSAVLVKNEVTREEFSKLMKSTREFGEPGFIFVAEKDIQFNPCAEISMYPKNKEGKSGWSACNLTEINGKFCSTEEEFLQACRASAIIGTLQAGYTSLPYLGTVSEEIFKGEALLGCSITGIMDNPDILLNPELQRKGAEEIKRVNEKIASLININVAARSTCVKPAGSTSCILGTASGIHPHHARRYIRRVQANKSEFCLGVVDKLNPIAVEESVWSANGTDKVISFLCEVPNGSIIKNQVGAVDLLEKVKLTQQNWVEYGTRNEKCVIPNIRHNVSNTIVVREDEWENVEKFIYDNKEWFAGISLLPSSGDLDYPQAPFATVLTSLEIVKEYGDASVFASGLIVDGLKSFDNNLWKACDTVMGRGESIAENCEEPKYPTARNNKELAKYFMDKIKYDDCFYKIDWVRRVKQFATRYFDGDIRRACYCLKHVSLWKTWCDLKREYIDIDWTQVTENSEEFVNADTLGSQACSGSGCELI